MSTNFPTSLDSFSAPGVTLASNPHSTLHTNIQDSVAAVEAKVGVNSSAVATTIDYLLKNASSVSPGHKHATADITDAGSYISTGIIVPYVGSSAPTGFLLCDGSAVSRTTYAALFALTSTTYGAGNGATTFNVPDLRSRMPIGAGTGTKVLTFASRSSNTLTVTGSTNSSTNEVQTGQAVTYHTTGSVITGLTNDTVYYLIRVAYNQFTLASTLANAVANTVISLSGDGSGTQTFTQTLTARTAGDTGGEETHAVTTAELAAHSHTMTTPYLPRDHTVYASSGGASALGNPSIGAGTDLVINNTGSSTAHDNMSPFLVLNYIIKT